MQLEYFEPSGPSHRPVLLAYSDDPDDFRVLRDAIEDLIASGMLCDMKQLPGIHGVNDCSLVAELGPVSLGVVTVDRAALTFRCVLDRDEWWQISGLLEPFATTAAESHRHQYLSGSGAVEWIVATDRSW